MSVIVDLVTLYEEAGFAVQANLSPLHFPGHSPADIPFTYVFGPNGQMCKGGGIAFTEIAFFEALCERIQPRTIFIVGNAFGWSTLALALMNPSARTVAIDLCPRPDEARGLEVTNALARRAGLDVRAIKGKSPDDVAAVCAREVETPIDLVFIDGGHTPSQQTLDFTACRNVAAPDCVYVFHDVVNFALVDSFVEIAQGNPDLSASLLMRTTSGMGICYHKSRAPTIEPVVRAFTETEDRIRALRTAAGRPSPAQ